MKAIVYQTYGPPNVLHLATIPQPPMKDDQILVKIHASTVTHADTLMRRGDKLIARMVLGIFRPARRFRVLGIEFSGVVAARGSSVTKFALGDEVYGFAGWTPGTYAEFAVFDEKASIAPKPQRLSHGEAASIIDGASTAIYFLRDKAKIKKGDRVLIIGASGSIGSAAIQIAKCFGAHVTGHSSGKNHGLLKSLGADEVIDYETSDYESLGQTWDLIFDTLGKTSFAKARSVLGDGGRYITTIIGLRNFVLSLWTSLFRTKRLITGMSVNKLEALALMASMIAEGRLRPVVDKIYSLEQIPLAHAYVETGRKKGNVIIDLVNNGAQS